ncbi:hypothetical protein BDW02DRAFT_575187 [Decorospora gaudefroyi]|uniref:Uncharacterized protein n=1 Tax=Decorospora gaudefroyi TaxID=184978 RepID=A0A6A5K1F9_9PLEO|nr:hypothetical protein BDW02DRAFT_575187 [Decorospora gaudefroyi]
MRAVCDTGSPALALLGSGIGSSCSGTGPSRRWLWLTSALVTHPTSSPSRTC